MLWFLIPSFLIAICYATIMILFLKGWHTLSKSKKTRNLPEKNLSVLIAFRNEEANILTLITALRKQEYPEDKLEIILVDDHSTDHSLEISKNAGKELPNFQIISLPDNLHGKKAAIRFGLSHVKGEILLLSDADCLPPPSWCRTMLNSFYDKETGLVLGPVILAPALTTFQKIQQLDYMSMLVSGAGSVGIGKEILAFGPNMAVRTSLYQSMIQGIRNDIPSGDDMFVLERAKLNNNIRIKFAKDEAAIVSSPPASSFNNFWNQRKRWVSKSGNYHDRDIIIVSIMVYLMNFTIFLSLILAISSLLPWWVFLIMIGTKTLFEYPLIREGAKFFKIRNAGWSFLLTQMFYFIYIVLVLPAGILAGYNWKNRAQR